MTEKLKTNKIIREQHFPMMIFGDEKARLTCPYELYPNDNVLFQYLNKNPSIVHIQAKSKGLKSNCSKCSRHFLFSKTFNQYISTASGYQTNFPVEVYSWKERNGTQIDESEKQAIEIIHQVKMNHVEGLENAIQNHLEKIKNLKLEHLSLEESKKIYEAILYRIPKY